MRVKGVSPDGKKAVEFESEETRFIFNAQRKIDQIVPLVRNDAHKIIEECMIQANVAAARYIEKNEAAALFRVHDRPGEERLTGFRDFLAELGLELKGGLEPEPKDFAELAAKFEGRPDAELLSTMLLRSMRQAVYQADNIGHFGLALKSYAHFTSPIRRYPDVLVHRVLQQCLDKAPQIDKKMEAKCKHCSERERSAMESERAANKYKQVEYMSQFLGEEFDGVVSGVASFGFWVETLAHKCEGLVSIVGLSEFDDFRHIESDYSLVGKRSGRSFKMGDKVFIKVIAANLDKRQLDYEWVQVP